MSELPDTNDPHELLGVDREADKKTIRRAYLALAKRFKPEHSPEEFRRIRQAYESALQHLAMWKAINEAAQHGEEEFDAEDQADDEPGSDDQPSGREVSADELIRSSTEGESLFDLSSQPDEVVEDQPPYGPSELWPRIAEEDPESMVALYEQAMAERPGEARLYGERALLERRLGKAADEANHWIVKAFNEGLDIWPFVQAAIPPWERLNLGAAGGYDFAAVLDHPHEAGAAHFWRIHVEGLLCRGLVEDAVAAVSSPRFQEKADEDDFWKSLAQRTAAAAAWWGETEATRELEEWVFDHTENYSEYILEVKRLRRSDWQELEIPGPLNSLFGIVDTVFWDTAISMAATEFEEIERDPEPHLTVLLQMSHENWDSGFLNEVNTSFEELLEIPDDEGGFFVEGREDPEEIDEQTLDAALVGVARGSAVGSWMSSNRQWLAPLTGAVVFILSAVILFYVAIEADSPNALLLLVLVGWIVSRQSKHHGRDRERVNQHDIATMEAYRRLNSVGAKPSVAQRHLLKRRRVLGLARGSIEYHRKSATLRFLLVLRRLRRRIDDA